MPRYRVLIADRDELLLASYGTFLQGEDFAVATATTGLECLARLRDFTPDVIVLEPELLWGRGEEVLAVMAEEGVDEAHVQVLILSHHHDGELGSDRGAFPVRERHLKPMMPRVLARRIRGLVDRRRRPGEFVTEWS